MVDIGRAGDALKAITAELNYQNLDELEMFEGINTTTEFLARHVFDRMRAATQGRRLGPGCRWGHLDEDHAVGEPHRLGGLRGRGLSRTRLSSWPILAISTAGPAAISTIAGWRWSWRRAAGGSTG